uniref:Uncharacterized protein n=1 Tax=Alexandrium catenella TaxID=2925 RepID=A0A7S1R4G9_ALECA|mmetsp:Transcript_4394/g.11718  ORF Transcript_4394/g.11718 Transcript_4394/m.11718 type:complete len:146 (+) Transcript_4394:3-440(+)
MRPVLVLDAEGRDYPVLECSPGFRARVGRLPPNTSLRDVVRDEGTVLAWMRETLTCISDRRPVPGPCELTLCMDHGQVTAICSVIKVGNFYDALRAADAPSPEGSGDENDLLRIELLLSHIRHCPGTRHRPRRRFRSAPPALASL